MQTQNARDILLEIIQKHAEKNDPVPNLSAETIEGIYHFAYQFYLNGKYAEAVKFFRFLTLVALEQKKHWMGLGAALQMQKEYAQAINSYSVAAILDEQDPYVHIYAADCFFALDRVEEGLRALSSAKKGALLNKQSLIPELDLLIETWEKRLKEKK